MPDPIIGERDFVDGVRRPVYRDDQGQYVFGDNGEKLRGWWLKLTEMEWEAVPIIVVGKAEL